MPLGGGLVAGMVVGVAANIGRLAAVRVRWILQASIAAVLAAGTAAGLLATVWSGLLRLGLRSSVPLWAGAVIGCLAFVFLSILRGLKAFDNNSPSSDKP